MKGSESDVSTIRVNRSFYSKERLIEDRTSYVVVLAPDHGKRT